MWSWVIKHIYYVNGPSQNLNKSSPKKKTTEKIQKYIAIELVQNYEF